MEATKNIRIVKAKRLINDSFYEKDVEYLVKIEVRPMGIQVSLASDGSNNIEYSDENELHKYWEEIEEQKQEERKFALEITYENNSPKLHIKNDGVYIPDIITMLELAKIQQINSRLRSNDRISPNFTLGARPGFSCVLEFIDDQGFVVMAVM